MAIYPSSPDLNKPISPVPDGEPGDLVGTAAFPNVPLYLWNDTNPAPGKKYTSAYFDRFPNVWSQGDFAAVHPQTGHIHILGRSDGVLNPSGIRFGSADIYAVLEGSFAKEVAESLCVGQRRPQDHDESVVLFLLMKPGVKFNAELAGKIRERIAKELTKRHVPKYIFEVPDIPVSVYSHN
jgi:acetoacetyl-CoA synthetase